MFGPQSKPILLGFGVLVVAAIVFVVVSGILDW